MRIVDLSEDLRRVDEAAALLHDAFLGRSEDWQDLDSARTEVISSLSAGRVSRIAIDAADRVLGWVGAIPAYNDRVWELHPLVVSRAHRRQGIGRALVDDVERLVAARGGLTLWLGSDDEHGETSLSGADLYTDPAGAIGRFRKLRGDHPADVYLRLGFHVVGVMPDANGRGKPDIFFARRVR